MITAEQLQAVNGTINTIQIKGKQYATANARIAAFRSICPSGSITTEILAMEDGVVTMQTTIKDEDGRILASGLAHEKEDASALNKTSYIENCETSAVGRALGMLGIGANESVASAEEMTIALVNQAVDQYKETVNNELIDESQQKVLKVLCEKRKLDPQTIFTKWPKLTQEQYVLACKELCKPLCEPSGEK